MGTARETRQYVVVTPAAASTLANDLPRLELFQADGSTFGVDVEKMPLQADAAAFTSSAAAGANPTKAEFDALRTDALAVRTTVNGLLAKLKAAGYMATS